MRKYATQMEAAKQGIITPEMKTVAEKEFTDPEIIRERVALGQVAIPANINHKSLCAEGIGKGLRTGNYSLQQKSQKYQSKWCRCKTDYQNQCKFRDLWRRQQL